MATQKILIPLAADGLPHGGYVRLPQILAVYPVSRSTFLKMVQDGKFPRPVKLGLRCSAWRVEDVRALLASFAQVTVETIDENVKKAVAGRSAKAAEV